MKNIVILTRGYYPDMSPVSAVIDKYIQYLKGRYCFHIIAVPTRLKYEKFNDPHIKIHYISSRVYKFRLRFEDRYRRKKSLVNWSLIQIFRLRTAILTFFDETCVTRWEEKRAFDCLQDLGNCIKIDTIISMSGLIVHTHLAAKKYKELHPSVRWITFLTDPISLKSSSYTIFHSKKRNSRNLSQELGIYESADYNIFVENLYQDAITTFNQPKEKTICFQYVLDPSYASERNRENKENGIIKLVYAGSLYRVIRNPEYMLSIISKIEEIHLDMYVRAYECYDILNKYESDRIVVNKSVSTAKYKEMICNEYDVLLNIGNNCHNQIPSKMLEYLSTGRPIINFYTFKDSQYEMIENYPLGLNIGVNEMNAVEKVSQFCKTNSGKRLAFHEVEQLFPNNCLQSQAAYLETLFNKEI